MSTCERVRECECMCSAKRFRGGLWVGNLPRHSLDCVIVAFGNGGCRTAFPESFILVPLFHPRVLVFFPGKYYLVGLQNVLSTLV